MRRLVLLLVALVFGCDDPAVSAKALDVLERGGLDASISCVFTGCSVQETYSATRFADGSVLASVRGLINFRIRGTADALTFKATSGPHNTTVEAIDGELVETGWCSAAFDIESSCTGFNLEAFGVE